MHYLEFITSIDLIPLFYFFLSFSIVDTMTAKCTVVAHIYNEKKFSTPLSKNPGSAYGTTGRTYSSMALDPTSGFPEIRVVQWALDLCICPGRSHDLIFYLYFSTFSIMYWKQFYRYISQRVLLYPSRNNTINGSY